MFILLLFNSQETATRNNMNILLETYESPSSATYNYLIGKIVCGLVDNENNTVL